jgi:hypothetical protein
LIHLIVRAVAKHLGKTIEEAEQVVGHDWWVDRTRCLWLEASQCTAQLLADLHSLLSDEYTEWRITVGVSEDEPSSEDIGQLVIYPDRIVVEKDVFNRLGEGRLKVFPKFAD